MGKLEFQDFVDFDVTSATCSNQFPPTKTNSYPSRWTIVIHPELCAVSSCSVEGGGSLVTAGLWESITWGMNFFGQPGGCGWSFRYPNCKTEGWAGGIEPWPPWGLAPGSARDVTLCRVEVEGCPRNPRGISSLIVGNPPSSARWRRITQIPGFAPTIVQLSSTVNICEIVAVCYCGFLGKHWFFLFSKQPTVFLFPYYFSFLQSKSKVLWIYPGRPCHICYNLARCFYHKRFGIYKLTPTQSVSHRLAKGATPLMCSILSGAFEAAAILLAAGASASEGRC